MLSPGDVPVVEQSLPDGILLRPSGEIDVGRSPSLREHLKRAQATGPSRLVVDMGDVPYMDSSGLATLVEAMRGARGAGTRLILCNLHERVRSVFEIARLDDFFTITSDVEQAVGA